MKQVSLLLFATCISVLAQPEDKNETALAEVRKAVDNGNAQWIEARDKADAAMISNLFAEEGILLGRNGKMFKGRQQIFERQKTVMGAAGKGVKATVTTVDLWVNGDTAYETGKYSYTFQEKGQPAIEEGRYVTMWKRQHDGSWKIVMDMGIPKT